MTASNFGCVTHGEKIVFASVRVSKLPSNNRSIPELSIKSTVSRLGSFRNKEKKIYVFHLPIILQQNNTNIHMCLRIMQLQL